MRNSFKRIWDLALPFQDKRDDEGHVATVVGFAAQLVETENADEHIVIPAAILHDVGWSQLSEEERFLPFRKHISPEIKRSLRLEHQRKGVSVAQHILEHTLCPQSDIDEILEIVSQHDTRKGFLSVNEGVMRDADKLWRFTKKGFLADIRRKEISFEKAFTTLQNNLSEEQFFFSDSARSMAEELLENILEKVIKQI